MSKSRLIQQEYSDLEASIQILREEKARLELSISQMLENKDSVIAKLNTQRTKVNEDLRNLGDKKDKLDVFGSKLSSKERELQEVESILNKRISQSEAKIKELDDVYLSHKDKLDNELVELELTIGLAKETCTNLSKQIDDLISQNKQLEQIKKDKLDDFSNYSHYYNKSIKDMDKTLSRKEKEIESLNKTIELLKQQISAQESTFDSIRLELLKREEDIIEKEENLIILQHRFKTQLQTYFPHLNVNI